MSTVAALRKQIELLEDGSSRARTVLPFAIPELDARLPGGGLALGALHEVAGGGNGAVDGAAAVLFAAGIAARTKGKVLWCITRSDLFAPGLAQAGLAPDRTIFVEVGDDKTVLACMEEGLRYGGLGAVIGEVAHMSMTASRRLQLAAEGSGSVGIVLRRGWRRAGSAEFGQPTASMTRWRVSASPSTRLPVPGVGRPRWLVELISVRAGESAKFELESCDETGRLALPADMVYRSGAAGGWRRSAAG